MGSTSRRHYRWATSDGECLLINGAAVYDDLSRSEPEAVRVLAAPHVRMC